MKELRLSLYPQDGSFVSKLKIEFILFLPKITLIPTCSVKGIAKYPECM